MKVIIYGAGKWGLFAYWEYVDNANIVCFCDNNTDLWGKIRFGTNVKVESPRIIQDFKGAVVVVAIQKYDEVLAELKKFQGQEVIIYRPLANMDAYVNDKQFRINAHLMSELGRNRCIWVKDYLEPHNELRELSFMYGGSGILDYAFLISTVKKFKAKTYLEIGTYIGDSINCVADYCERCYSVTASEDSPYYVEYGCREDDIPNYSNKLVYKDNITQFKCLNSRDFQYNKINDDIDVYFIDADHRYDGVYSDTQKVFSHKKDDAIVVWHDFRNQNYTTALAIKNAIGDKNWDNVYCTDKSMCGIYIPEKFKDLIRVRPFGFNLGKDEFYTMTVHISFS